MSSAKKDHKYHEHTPLAPNEVGGEAKAKHRAKARVSQKKRAQTDMTHHAAASTATASLGFTGRFQDMLMHIEEGMEIGLSTEVGEEEVKQIETHYTVPTAPVLVGMQLLMAVGYIGYSLSAWMYCNFHNHNLFPKCGELWTTGFMQLSCMTSVTAFWSFPLALSNVILAIFHRDLVLTRLWYELFGHKVILNLRTEPFFQAKVTRICGIWMLLGATHYFFAWRTSIKEIRATLPYWMPVFSLLSLLYTSWDLGNRLLSIVSFMAGDPKWGKKYIHQCVNLDEHTAAEAFWRVHCTREAQEALDEQWSLEDSAQKKHKSAPADSGKSAPAEAGDASASSDPAESHRSLPGVADEEEDDHANHNEHGSLHNKLVRSKNASSYVADMVKEAAKIRKGMAEESKSIRALKRYHLFDTSHWVHRFLYWEHLEDDHSKRFRRWFGAYSLIMMPVMFALFYCFFATILTICVNQDVIRDGWFVHAIALNWTEDIQKQWSKIPEHIREQYAR